MLINWTHELFTENLNSSFALQHPQWGRVILHLVSVSDLRETPHQRMFSLIFSGPLDQPLQQGLHPLTHKTMGTEDLFLVPVSRETDGFRYEAVFNNLVQ